MGMNFRLDIQGLADGLVTAQMKADAAIRMYAENGALKLQNYARQHRKWTDRTGHARQRLTGTSMAQSNGYRLQLAHGVDYGIWLELAHEKRFAIIESTIRKVGTEQILPGFNKLLERL